MINFRKISELNRQIIYNRRIEKYRMVRKRVMLDEYVFYSILNTDIPMELGVAASMVRIKNKIVIKAF